MQTKIYFKKHESNEKVLGNCFHLLKLLFLKVALIAKHLNALAIHSKSELNQKLTGKLNYKASLQGKHANAHILIIKYISSTMCLHCRA